MKKKKTKKSPQQQTDENILQFTPKTQHPKTEYVPDPSIQKQARKVLACLTSKDDSYARKFELADRFNEIPDDVMFEIFRLATSDDDHDLAEDALEGLAMLTTERVDQILHMLLASPDLNAADRSRILKIQEMREFSNCLLLDKLLSESGNPLEQEFATLLGDLQEGILDELDDAEHPDELQMLPDDTVPFNKAVPQDLDALIMTVLQEDAPVEEAFSPFSEEAMQYFVQKIVHSNNPASAKFLAYAADLVPDSVALIIVQALPRLSQDVLPLLLKALVRHPSPEVHSALENIRKNLRPGGVQELERELANPVEVETEAYISEDINGGDTVILFVQSSAMGRIRSAAFLIETWQQGLARIMGMSIPCRADATPGESLLERIEEEMKPQFELTPVSPGRARAIIEAAAEYSLKQDFPLPTGYTLWKGLLQTVEPEPLPANVVFGLSCAECGKDVETYKVFNDPERHSLNRTVLLCNKCERTKTKKCSGCGNVLGRHPSWRSYSRKRQTVDVLCKNCVLDRTLALSGSSLETDDFCLTTDDVILLAEAVDTPPRHKETAILLDRVLNVYPKTDSFSYAFLHERYSEILEAQGKFSLALEELSRSVEDWEKEGERLSIAQTRRKAKLRMKAGDLNGGMACLLDEISANPKDFISYECLVRTLMELGQFKLAEKHLRDAFEAARKRGISKGRQKSLLGLKHELYKAFPENLKPKQDELWG